MIAKKNRLVFSAPHYLTFSLLRQRKSNKKKDDFWPNRCATAKAKAARGPRAKK